MSIVMFEPSPEEDRRRSEARIVMLRVGLALVDDARHGGGFETDETKLAARVEGILESLRAAGANSRATVVQAIPESPERVHLSTPTSEHGSAGVLLRSDGILLEQFTTMGVSFEAESEEDLSSEELKELEAEQAEWAEQVERETFRGERFLRALTPDPQPGAEVQLLGAELFDDGLVVHYSFEQTQEEFEASIDEDPMHEAGAPQGLRVEDDIGTEYGHRGGGASSAGVVRSSYSFTPAVPEAARTLRISTRSGTVELPLRD